MIEDHLLFVGFNVLLAWSVYVILLSGVMSFGNGAFMAIGAYVAGILTVKFGYRFELALLASAAACLASGVLIGFPALRTRGLYLIMVTIGVAFCVRVGAENISYIGGVRGLRGLTGTSLYHVGIAVGVVGVALWALSRSPLQRILDAIREDEEAAGALGINVLYVRLAMFAIGASLAGFVGGLYGHYMVFIAPDHFDIRASIFIVLYVILGGSNNPWGPALGATLMTLLPEYIRGFAEWRAVVFSILLILLLMLRPEGLLAFRRITARSASAGLVREARPS